MILSTRGIVLHSMDYSETSIIVRVYTEQLGLQSYIVKGVRKKGARLKRNLFSPLSVLKLVANHKEGEGLRVLREAACFHQLNSIATNMSKMTVSIYMSELLTRTITAQMQDPNLYAYLEESILRLEETSGSVAGFPLSFTIGLSHFMGFDPHNNFSDELTYFDLMEGDFCQHPPSHPHYFSSPLSNHFSEVLTALDAGIVFLSLANIVRTELLSKMLEYFRIHIPGFGELKSVKVLTDLLRE